MSLGQGRQQQYDITEELRARLPDVSPAPEAINITPPPAPASHLPAKIPAALPNVLQPRDIARLVLEKREKMLSCPFLAAKSSTEGSRAPRVVTHFLP